MPLCPPDPRRCPKLSYVCETKAPDEEESKSRDEEGGQEEATK